MHFNIALVASVLFASSVYAQDPSTPAYTTTSSSSSSATSGVTVHVVKVSNPDGALAFSPNSLQAVPGDMVQWQFYPKNHSVVMASFAQPCVPIQQSDPANAANAFFSGFMPVASETESGKLTYTIMVKDTKPLWYYCSQGQHCQSGMVGVINPPSDSAKTIEAFAANAKNAPNNITPDGSTAASPSSSSASASSSTTSVTVEPSSAASLVDASTGGFFSVIASAFIAYFML